MYELPEYDSRCEDAAGAGARRSGINDPEETERGNVSHGQFAERTVGAFGVRASFFQAFGSRLAVQERYNESSFFRIPSRCLQGVALRPLPCNYNVIQSVSALSRR